MNIKKELTRLHELAGETTLLNFRALMQNELRELIEEGDRENEFLQVAVRFFGESKQQTVCIEEMAELTQQLCKFLINHPNKSREKLVEEYVDVLIMLNQIGIIFNITDKEIENGKSFKFDRLKKFIKSKEGYNK